MYSNEPLLKLKENEMEKGGKDSEYVRVINSQLAYLSR
jgi:hypothetical protein